MKAFIWVALALHLIGALTHTYWLGVGKYPRTRPVVTSREQVIGLLINILAIWWALSLLT